MVDLRPLRGRRLRPGARDPADLVADLAGYALRGAVLTVLVVALVYALTTIQLRHAARGLVPRADAVAPVQVDADAALCRQFTCRWF